MKTNHNAQYSGLNLRVWDFAALVLHNRFARALEEGASRYPIFRELRYAARVELEVLFDAIALEPAWRAQRINGELLILDGDGVFVAAYGRRKLDYASCSFYIWAADLQRASDAKGLLLEKAGPTRVTEPMFTIDWHFANSGYGNAEGVLIEEIANDVLHDGAYPEIPGGVRAFIPRYLDAPETVLVLQGPPGTGKTRLIRAILGEMTRRKGEPAQAIYTGDAHVLESDQLFVRFITGRDDAFVVEDADHQLTSRANGNLHLHRFLTVADGVVRSQGRKIIFSTNLPNIRDLDEALVRPGRCFAHVNVRRLTGPEAKALAAEIGSAHVPTQDRNHSLAEIYQAPR